MCWSVIRALVSLWLEPSGVDIRIVKRHGSSMASVHRRHARCGRPRLGIPRFTQSREREYSKHRTHRVLCIISSDREIVMKRERGQEGGTDARCVGPHMAHSQSPPVEGGRGSMAPRTALPSEENRNEHGYDE